jgi:hypothetical protein
MAMLLARINVTLFADGASASGVPALLAAAGVLSVVALGASDGPSRRIANEDAALTLKGE